MYVNKHAIVKGVGVAIEIRRLSLIRGILKKRTDNNVSGMFKGKEEYMPRDLCGTSGNSSVAVPSRSMKESIERLQGWFRWQLVGLRQLHVVCVQRPVIGLSAVATSGLCHSVEKNIKERIGEEEQACSALGAPLKGRIAFSTLSCRRPLSPPASSQNSSVVPKRQFLRMGQRFALFGPTFRTVAHTTNIPLLCLSHNKSVLYCYLLPSPCMLCTTFSTWASSAFGEVGPCPKRVLMTRSASCSVLPESAGDKCQMPSYGNTCILCTYYQ